MTFNNFLDLIDNLSPTTNFFIQVNEKRVPLAKITASGKNFLAITGNKSMTKLQILQIFAKMNDKNLPFLIQNDKETRNIYGLQLNAAKNMAILK